MRVPDTNQNSPTKAYVFALATSAVATALALPLRDYLNPANAVMFYLLGVILTAARYGRRASIAASIFAFLAYNFFFTKPYYTFYVNDYKDVLTLLLLLVSGIIAGAQTSKLQAERNFFRTKEHNTSVLYAMSNELTATRGREQIVATTSHHIEEAFNAQAIVWSPSTKLEVLREEQAARWAYEHQQSSGLGTTTLPGAQGYYIPLKGTEYVLGVMPRTHQSFTADEREMIHTFANLAASALERTDIAEMAEKTKVEAEGEKLRNALLSAVSHDFRTPLSSIKGVISSLLMEDNRLQPDDKKELLASAHGEVARLERIVSNLLEVTLLDSGKLKLKQDYYFLPELVGNALKQTESVLQGRKIACQIPPNLPALYVDGLLIEQVLVNLLENAAKYTPEGSPVALHCNAYAGQVKIVIEDEGSGIPAGEEEKIFDAFHTAVTTQPRKGSGLGLAICRGILQAHEGNIKVENRSEGGAIFTIILPVGAVPVMTEVV